MVKLTDDSRCCQSGSILHHADESGKAWQTEQTQKKNGTQTLKSNRM